MEIDIYKVLDQFFAIPEKLDDISSEAAFAMNWRRCFGSEAAKRHNAIVYVWKTEKYICRVKGESPILYIGKTINSLCDRHYQYAQREAKSSYNKPRHEFIIKNYGPIEIFVLPAKDLSMEPKEAEKSLLMSYFYHHLEIPPFNRMSL